jgi:flagellar assembly protein FliH
MSSSTKTDQAEADAKKFMFDTNDFNKGGRNQASYTEEQMMAAQAQAHAAGKAEGTQETRKSQEEAISLHLNKIGQKMEKIAADEERRDLESMSNATKIAMKIAHKLLPAFSKKFSLAEIENVVLQSLDARKDEPRIAISVPPVHLDALKARVDALAHEKGYAGKMILVADDHLAETDCRVEWADGGTERLYARLSLQIENECTKAIESIETTQNKV